jgi:hypothetical protein
MTGTMKSEIYPWLCKGMFFALVLFLATAPLSTMAEGKFLSAIDDFPLMTELDEVGGGVMEFDSPSGRIVEALTIGKVSKQKVQLFYRATLPQLGWKETAAGNFSREGEVLKLEFPRTMSGSQDSAIISVLFMFSPAK